MACGEEGSGRMAEPHEILAAAERLLKPASRPLTGLRALVTSGPTHEAIDPVRYVANRSSGRQGHAVAAALAEAGAEVTLVTGPVALPDPPGVRVRPVVSAREMLAAVEAGLPADVAVFAAAVADWRPAVAPDRKMKKVAGAPPPALEMVENPDILRSVARRGSGEGAAALGRRPSRPRPAATWRPRPRRSWTARAATGSSPTTSRPARRLRRRPQPCPPARPRRHARGLARARQGRARPPAGGTDRHRARQRPPGTGDD
jgi:hypothetical protein